MGNDHWIRHLLPLLLRRDCLELLWSYSSIRMGRVMAGFRGGLEEGIVVELIGLERAGEVVGDREQKYEEDEGSDLPGRWRRR